MFYSATLKQPVAFFMAIHSVWGLTQF